MCTVPYYLYLLLLQRRNAILTTVFLLVSRTYYRRYSPYPGYPPDTRMLWRIEYVVSSGALIPSPVWGFQTRAFPDFKVEKVLVPPNAFSGQTFEVSWIVRNNGKVGNTLTTWYDAVFIGKSTDFRSARFVLKTELIS